MINTKLGMDMNIYIEWEKKLIFLKASKYRKHHKIWKNNIKKLPDTPLYYFILILCTVAAYFLIISLHMIIILKYNFL